MLLNKIRTTSNQQCCFTTSTTKDDGGHHRAISKYLQDKIGIDNDESVHNGIIKAFESIYGKDNVTVEHIKEFDKEDMGSLIESVQNEIAKKKKKKKTKKDASVVSGNNTTENKKTTMTAATTTTRTTTSSSPPRRRSIPVLFKVPHNNNESKEESFEVSWKLGDNLLQLSQQNEDVLGEEYTLEGACGGTMSCCTCHVYLKNDDVYKMFPPPSENELDMLDLAYEPIDNCSRLGCQVTLSPNILLQQDNHGASSTRDDDDDDANTTDGRKVIEVTLPSGVNNVWT